MPHSMLAAAAAAEGHAWPFLPPPSPIQCLQQRPPSAAKRGGLFRLASPAKCWRRRPPPEAIPGCPPAQEHPLKVGSGGCCCRLRHESLAGWCVKERKSPSGKKNPLMPASKHNTQTPAKAHHNIQKTRKQKQACTAHKEKQAWTALKRKPAQLPKQSTRHDWNNSSSSSSSSMLLKTPLRSLKSSSSSSTLSKTSSSCALEPPRWDGSGDWQTGARVRPFPFMLTNPDAAAYCSCLVICAMRPTDNKSAA